MIVASMKAMTSGTQPPSKKFQNVRREERLLDQQQRNDDKDDAPERPFPALPDDEERHHRVDDHRRGNRYAISGREIGRGAEGENDDQNGDEKQPVDPRHVDLAGHAFRGVPDLETRNETELNGLPRQRKGPCYHGLAGDHRRERRQNEHRDQHEIGVEPVERIFDRVRVVHDERALPEIIENQRGHDEIHPRHGDRTAAEMPEIGVERFGARTGEKHEAHHGQAEHAVMVDETHALQTD